MTYFKKFPFVKDYKIQNKKYTGIDITRRTGIPTEIKNDLNVYQEYVIQDGESAHVIADRVYNNASWYFVILMFNDIHDELSQWPLDQITLQNYIEHKYETPNGVHHYEAVSTGAWIDIDYPEYDKIPITNYEFEINLNEKRRKIKIPLPNYAFQIVAEHQNLMRI